MLPVCTFVADEYDLEERKATCHLYKNPTRITGSGESLTNGRKQATV
jgi:hypothetical protein